jgi:hypothetical protein
MPVDFLRDNSRVQSVAFGDSSTNPLCPSLDTAAMPLKIPPLARTHKLPGWTIFFAPVEAVCPAVDPQVEIRQRR